MLSFLNRSLLSALLAVVVLGATVQAQSMPLIQLSAGVHLIKAEIAANNEHRQQGLMFRQKMAANEGMLFIFEQNALHCMWMKNTLIPLSVAFLDEQGRILNIEDMQPQTLENHCAVKPAKFALEVNLGWFKQRGIQAGSKISGVTELLKPLR